MYFILGNTGDYIMPVNENLIRIPLGITGDIEDACIEDAKGFVKWLSDHLVGLAPTSITNVVVSNQEPTDRNVVWFRRSNAGVFIGIYIYSGTKWNQIFPAPDAVFWMVGDSRDVPDGYELVDTSGPTSISSYTRDFLVTKYQRDPGDTYYTYFATVFVGL